MSSLLGPDAVFTTILRNPTDVFESLYSYYRLEKRLNASVEHFIGNRSLAAANDQYLNKQLRDLGLGREQVGDREGRYLRVVLSASN